MCAVRQKTRQVLAPDVILLVQHLRKQTGDYDLLNLSHTKQQKNFF